MSESKCPRHAIDVPAYAPPRSREDGDRLREASDVYYSAPMTRWFFTRHDAIAEALRDERLSVDPRKANPQPHTSRVVPLAEMGNITFVDPPDHTRLRRLVAQVFTPRFAESMRVSVEALADRLLGDLPEGPFDFLSSVARPMSLRVVACQLIGLAEEDLPEFVAHLADLSQTFNPAFPEERCSAARVSIKKLWSRVIDARREHPTNDFVSLLLEGQSDAKVSESELLEMLTVTFMAGNVSTAEMMNNTLHALLTHPAELAKVRSDLALMSNAVEETLRVESPITQAARIVPVDLEFQGCAMKAGEAISLLTAVAARAADVNPEPSSFDVTRTRIRHQAFGGGQHICIGAPLARMETEIIVAATLRRFPALRLDPSRPPVEKNGVVHGLESLWLIG